MAALAGCASHGGQSQQLPPPDAAPPDLPPPTPSDVVGTMRTTCHDPSGDIDTSIDASKRAIQAYVPDASPAGYRVVTGTGSADGSFVLPDVPAGVTYVLQISTGIPSERSYFATDQRALDVRFEHQGRCMPKPVPASATFSVTAVVTNRTPFGLQGEGVELDSFKLGFGTFAGNGALQLGADAMTATFSWPRGFALVDAAAGDDLYVLHNRTDQGTDDTTGSSFTTTHIVDWFDATGTTLDSQPASITGAFQSATSTPSAARTGTLAIALDPFEAIYDKTTRPERFTVQLLAQPGGGVGFGSSDGSAVLLSIGLGPFADRALTNTYRTNYSYADPFPASWKRAITVDSQRSHLVRLSTDPTASVGVGTGYHQQIEYAGALQVAAPALPRPTGITVGGVDFTRGGKVVFDGQSPVVIRWNPVPGAQLYQLSLASVSQTPGFFIDQATVSTADTSLTVPAALIQAGTRYQLVLTAVQTPIDYRGGQLIPPSLPRVTTGVPSGRFRFLPSCGDGVVQPGEDCDTSGESATCNEDCTTAMCGDGVINAAAGEQCDAINQSLSCTTACKLP
ncbi:MAG TPA: hypothetical protein VHW23_15385 [Kofleriaceae bacterium]|nr:hypothetical protein [Kofleriaceae bacterium]